MRKGSIGHSNARCRSVPMFQAGSEAIRRGTLTDECRKRVDRLIAQAVHEVRLHIRQANWRKEWIKHTLHLDVADRSKQVHDRVTKIAQGPQHLFSLRQFPMVAGCNCRSEEHTSELQSQ